MPKIIYLDSSETLTEITVDPGQSVMRAAILNSVDGIVGECGGQAMCATCHVFVQSVDGTLPAISEDEDEMLDCTADPRQPSSRLGCQLTAGADFSEIVVKLPESQV